MKGKTILALLLAVSMMTTNGSIAFAAEENIDDKEETVSVPNTGIIQDEVPSCGTEEELTEGNFSYTVSDGQATLTKYNGTDETAVEIPEMVQGNVPVTAISSQLFYHNTKIEKVIISENLVSMGNDPEDVFLGASNLKEINVKDSNDIYYDIDGVFFRYAADNGLPMLMKYPEAKIEDVYVIPDNTDYINWFAFYNCSNLKRIIVPSSVATIMLQGFDSLTDTTIVLQQTDSSQINLVDRAFTKFTNCRIIVKNERIKAYVEQQISGKTPLYNCTNTMVKIESELSADEKAKYLTPATSLTFSDGSTAKNVTLMPDGKCTHAPQEGSTRLRESWMDVDYTISPTDTTDIVTWESNNANVADVYVYNGRSVLIGISEGKCTITGTTESGKQITLNVTVQTPVDKTELTYNGSVNQENVVIDSDIFNERIHFDIYPYDATCRKNVTWRSSNPEIISVQKYKEGEADKTSYYHTAALTLNKPGTATITATLTDGSNVISQRSVTINVTKEEDVQNETETEENNDNAGADVDAGNNTDDSKDTGSNTGNGANGNKDSNTVKPAAKSSQKITNVSSSYKKAYKTSFTLKPKAKTSCTYKSSNTKIATVNSKGKVTIKGTGKVTITITAKMKTPSVKAGSKKLTVSWKKDSRADGYRIQYSTNSRFKNAKIVTCSKKTAKKTIKKLKSGKKYYVRIRSYKEIGGKKYYGSYSKTKSVKVK